MMSDAELETFGLRIREQSYREGYEAALRDIPIVVKAKDALGHGSYKKDERVTRANYKGLLHTPAKLLSTATTAASNIIRRLANIPGAALRTVKRVISAQYNKMEARYGKTYARLAVAAVVIGLPIPIPGSSMILMAGVRGLAELHMALDKRLAPSPVSPQEDTAAPRPGLIKRLASVLRSVVGLQDMGKDVTVKSFDESQHPRADDGKFSDKMGSIVWHDSLSEIQKHAIKEFTSGDFHAIRKMDRDGLTEDDDYPGSLHRETQEAVKALNDAFTSAPPYKGTIYRGMRNLNIAKADEVFSVGNEIQVEAVTSFSKRYEAGEHFAHIGQGMGVAGRAAHSGGDNTAHVVISIAVKKGIDISDISSYKNKDKESEVVLPKGSKWRVTHVERYESNEFGTKVLLRVKGEQV